MKARSSSPEPPSLAIQGVCGVHHGQEDSGCGSNGDGDTPDLPPSTACAQVESGYVSDFLWACGDVRDVCCLSSLFLLHMRPHGMVAPCPAPAISSCPVPQNTASPAKPPSVSASAEEDAVERRRVIQRRHFPASPAPAQAVQEQGQCSVAEQLGSGCPVEEPLAGTA